MIQGERIHLEFMDESIINWQEYFKWMNDPEVNKYMETRHQSQSIEAIKEYFQNHTDKVSEPWFAICINGSNEHIGNLKLGPINWIHRFADLSLFIGEKNYWGKGYGTEAIDLAVNYAFKILNLHKVKAGIYAPNNGSFLAFKRAGFKECGLYEWDRWLDGQYVDLIIMEKING